MTSLQQVSNWFSSLRRQPKNKKTLYNSGRDKNIHQSMCNLGPNSTFYVKPELPPAAGSEYKSNASIATTAASTANLQEDNDRRSLVTGKLVSQLCARCCCTLKSPNRNKTPTKTVDSTPTMIAKNDSSLGYCYDAPAFENTPPVSPTSSMLSCETTMATEVRRDVHIIRLPSTESNTMVYNKRCDFTHTTTTTSTRTLTITRPVELLLNERGEIVARRSKAKRSSSLDCVLDEEHEQVKQQQQMYDSESNTSTPSPISAPIVDVEELRFIDDSSNSQSENERNSQNNGNYCSNMNYANKLSKRSNMSLKLSSINTNNNNHNNLCEACKNVLDRNRNNAKNSPVIMRHQPQIKDELCEVVSTMEALDVPEDCKHSNKEKQMSIGRKKFNMDPKKGIEFLVENRLLRHDPQDVAHFLYKGEGLNKTAIGDYLGEKNDFNEDVLKAFVALHDFTNLILVQALRQFLWSFRLPGEAQKIDRMMECFAQRYCQLNPDIFTNTDTCYVLSFAIIMLNTSLHNPSVKDKPTVEQFISMNRGINNGGDLPRQLLESLYESIRTEPFKIPQDDGNDLMHTFFNPDKEGWLWKQGGRYKSWKRRWFILNDNCLYYFEYTTDKEPRGIIPLENISVREVQDRGKPYCFELFATGGADIIKACKTDSEGKVVEGKHTVYRMSAATEDEQQDWIKRLTQSISHNPFYDILVQRKKKALSKS